MKGNFRLSQGEEEGKDTQEFKIVKHRGLGRWCGSSHVSKLWMAPHLTDYNRLTEGRSYGELSTE